MRGRARTPKLVCSSPPTSHPPAPSRAKLQPDLLPLPPSEKRSTYGSLARPIDTISMISCFQFYSPRRIENVHFCSCLLPELRRRIIRCFNQGLEGRQEGRKQQPTASARISGAPSVPTNDGRSSRTSSIWDPSSLLFFLPPSLPAFLPFFVPSFPPSFLPPPTCKRNTHHTCQIQLRRSPATGPNMQLFVWQLLPCRASHATQSQHNDKQAARPAEFETWQLVPAGKHQFPPEV